MAFRDFHGQEQGIALLQRSLGRGRLAHAFLFTGSSLELLEALSTTLAKTLNCAAPVRSASGEAVDSCDACASCKNIQRANHGDVRWVRPESKSRVITIEQVRELSASINLKAGQGLWKLGIIVGADRLKTEAANAFLKTLEEPPPKSVFILLTMNSSKVLETILSRCMRLSFGGEGGFTPDEAQVEWVAQFAKVAAEDRKSLLSRYLVLDQLLIKLGKMREVVEQDVEARSPLTQHPDAEKDLREKWEEELKAAIESEYRGRRGHLLLALEFWLRDVWLRALRREQGSEQSNDLLSYPGVEGTARVAQNVSSEQALGNLEIVERLQGLLLGTNVQEALALEASLLRLRL